MTEPDWFRFENRWTWQTQDYSAAPAAVDLKKAAKTVLRQYGVDTAAQ